MDDDFNFLSMFLGPKAENGSEFREYINEITDDYLHWRKNYFPDDKVLINRGLQKKLDNDSSEIHNKLIEILSGLKRNFPFYSPRYIGHMLSDTLILSTLGFYAGMLYNPNNVTPEAAPVTTEWEIDVCNLLLQMLGYKSSPCPPPIDSKDKDQWTKYQSELKKEFGWAHLTSGGTVANIEALWVARTIKYYPLNIFEVARRKKMEIKTFFPDGKERSLLEKTLTEYDILNITPTQAIYLLPKFVEAVRSKYKLKSMESANKKAIELLDKSKYSIKSNLNEILSRFKPVILVSGTAHYSIKKAADILGIGQGNVINIEIDSKFRIVIKDVENKLKSCFEKGLVPIAVIGIAGTTEEGAVDPIHNLTDLREKIEKDQNKSFWIHIDAAWGGFIRSIFNLSEKQEIELLIDKFYGLFRIKKNLVDYYKMLNEIANKITKIYLDSLSDAYLRETLAYIKYKEIKREKGEKFRNKLRDWIEEKKYEFSDHQIAAYKSTLERDFRAQFQGLQQAFKQSDKSSFIHRFKIIIERYGLDKINSFILRKDDFEIKLQDRIVSTTKYLNDNIYINYGFNYEKKIKICWNDIEIMSSFLAFNKSDSITIDPHKMGYIHYPCGAVAFKNDRIRHYITHDAPYITSLEQNVLLHNPPRHIKDISFNNIEKDIIERKLKINITAFARFILEGSKPGSAAASLKLVTSVIPLTRNGYGEIIKQSIMAALEFYEWINSWDEICKNTPSLQKTYKVITVFDSKPDTNVIIFAISPIDHNINNPILEINKLTEKVYNRFTIQAEFGAKEFSYSQPFFLSKEPLTHPTYNYSNLFEFFHNERKCGLDKKFEKVIKKDLKTKGLTVLRATVMNPYLHSFAKLAKQNLFAEFFTELHKCLNE